MRISDWSSDVCSSDLLDTSLVNLAIKPIGADLAADVSRLQWVVDAYNLAYASFLLTGGALGDLHGRRRIFALGDFGYDDMIGKRGCTHVVMHRLATHLETPRAVGHEPLALRCAYRLA